jgi:hypothetical protein
MVLDLSDDEAAALAQLLRRTINNDPYPISPRLAPLKSETHSDGPGAGRSRSKRARTSL